MIYYHFPLKMYWYNTPYEHNEGYIHTSIRTAGWFTSTRKSGTKATFPSTRITSHGKSWTRRWLSARSLPCRSSPSPTASNSLWSFVRRTAADISRSSSRAKTLCAQGKSANLKWSNSALAGYETVNGGKKLLFDGSTIRSKDGFVYGGHLPCRRRHLRIGGGIHREGGLSLAGSIIPL